MYAIDELNSPEVTIKAVGHQWYWSYEYTDFLNTTYALRAGLDVWQQLIDEYSEKGLPFLSSDSALVQEEDLVFGSIRLLETD